MNFFASIDRQVRKAPLQEDKFRLVNERSVNQAFETPPTDPETEHDEKFISQMIPKVTESSRFDNRIEPGRISKFAETNDRTLAEIKTEISPAAERYESVQLHQTGVISLRKSGQWGARSSTVADRRCSE